MVFKEGNEPWNKGLKGKAYLSHYVGGVQHSKGKHHWKNKPHPRGFLGKKHTTEEKNKMSFPGQKNPMYGVRLEQNVIRMKTNNPMWNPEVAKRAHHNNGIKTKARMANLNYRASQLEKMYAGYQRPNKPESRVIELIKNNNLNFVYVGNGKFWIRSDQNVLFNPDFIDKENKLIIEVFGDYWHTRPDRVLQDVLRLQTYNLQGYRTLIIWEGELTRGSGILTDEELLTKIIGFMKGGNIHYGYEIGVPQKR